jgi:hypothetical protein
MPVLYYDLQKFCLKLWASSRVSVFLKAYDSEISLVTFSVKNVANLHAGELFQLTICLIGFLF